MTETKEEPLGILTYVKAQKQGSGAAITVKFTPKYTGHVDRFKISPKLPHSFVFNPMTGIIQGVISNAEKCHPAVHYSVTASNSAGMSEAEVELLPANEILSPPLALRYPGVHNYAPGEKVIFFPNYQGGKPTIYTVTPPLPDGLKLNGVSGEIRGHVRDGRQSYVVEARNICGATSADIKFAVGTAPKNLSFTGMPLMFSSYQRVTLSPSLSGSGKTVAFVVNPPLPNGLKLDASAGVIDGHLGRITLNHLTTYVVSAKNSYGETSFTIKLPGKLVFMYPAVPHQFFVGDVVKLTPTYNGVRPAKFSILPALPKGLFINPSTGEITGEVNKRISGEMQNYAVTVTPEGGDETSEATTHFGINVPIVAAAAGNNWATPVYVVISLIVLGAVMYLIQLLRKKDDDRAAYTKLISAIEDTPREESVSKLPLVFQTRTGLQTVYATHKPLGLVYQKSRLPIKITNVTESHGKDIGVQVGWVLKSINNRELSGFGNFEDIYHIMHEEMCKLPGGVAMTWDIGDRRERTVWAMKKPLGIVFDKSLPITITTETPGHGYDIGIRKGWILKRVNYIDLTRKSTFEEADAVLLEEIDKMLDPQHITSHPQGFLP
jgi:hypothetical protein